MQKIVIAFDLYGTILSTESIVKELNDIIGQDGKASTIAAQARRYQLEYTWRSNSMDAYKSFTDLTLASFRHAAAELSVGFTSDDESRLMNAYNGLETFEDADRALKMLADSPELDPYIFSNGSPSMLKKSMQSCNALLSASDVLPSVKVVSVDAVSKFKPDPTTYDHFLQAAGMGGQTDKVWLVSSNPFDALGAEWAGWRSVWVDRTGKGWIDGLGATLGKKPTAIVKGVDEAVKEILHRS